MEGQSDSVSSNAAFSSTTNAVSPSVQFTYEKMLAQLSALKLPSDLDRNYQIKGCLEHQARLLQALDAGYHFIVQKLLEIDYELSGTMTEYSGLLVSNFDHPEELDKALEILFDCLMTISNAKCNSLLRAMIEGDLGRYIFEGGELPKLLNEHSRAAYQPVVFVSIHCNDKGEAPSKAEYLVIVERIKSYLGISGGKSQQERDKYAQQIDFEGFISYGPVQTDTDYGAGSGSKLNRMHISQGHRFANTEEKIKALNDFVFAFEARLKAISDQDLESSIPWHLTHVGWSPQYGKQKKEYNKHDKDHIKCLVDIITLHEFPTKNYSMHTHPVASLPSAREVQVAHVISILTASYACYGGLNHTTVGTNADIDYAQQLPTECWKAGGTSLTYDGFILRNMVVCNLQIILGHAIAGNGDEREKIDDLMDEIAEIEDGNINGVSIEDMVVSNFATEFGRRAVCSLKPEVRKSTLRITHPELLAATEGNPARRLAIAPFIVIDEEPTELEVDFEAWDMDEDEKEGENEEMDESI